MLEFGFLGPLEVTSDGQSIPVTAPKQRALLAVLLINAGQMLSADRLIDAVWGEAPPSAAKRTLRYHVSKLRDALQPGREPGSAADSVLVTEGPGYRLAVAPDQIDSGAFEAELAAARDASDPDQTAAALRRALALWRGPALVEFEYEEFARTEIARLEGLRIACVEDRIAADLEADRASEVIGELESLVVQFPYRERLRGLLMTGLYRTGRQAEALQAYQAARRVLGEGLGIEPSAELRDLEERILLQDDSLTPTPTARRDSRPGGTVTFLFTDIAGSTRKWDRHPTAMREALTAHDEIAERVIGAHDGSIFKHTGDGLAVVFTSAVDAVIAAVEFRAAIAEKSWDDVDGLEIKQAINTGEAEPRGDDYSGPPVNVAARLAAAAHGGQILMGDTTAGMLGRQLPADLRLVDLGSHRLRNLSRPETIHQLQAKTDRDEFPPPRVAASLRSNLPEPLTLFIGRVAEVAALRRAVATNRMVTLTGIGGIGKTRLALEVAGGLVDDFEHGVFHVDCSALVSVDDAVGALLHAMTLEAEDAPVAALVRGLRDRETLVVLDAIEDLIEPVSSLATQLLEGCPSVRVLATSRLAPAVSGGHAWAVPPLLTPPDDAAADATLDAVQLFEDRARLIDPDFDASAAPAGLIADICRHLEGIPLALELAASRLKLLSLEAIAAASDHGIGTISRTSRTGADRRRTVAASLEWSFGLLPDPQRHLLADLTVFRGGFDFEAALMVCGGPSPDPDDMFDSLDGLVDAGLVAVDRRDGVRYGMLEAVRRHALAAAPGPDTDGDARHARYFADLAAAAYDPLAGSEEAAWLARLEREHANLAAAVQWTTENDDRETELRLVGNLGRFWLAGGYRREAESWLAAAEPEGDTVYGARLVAARVWVAMERGDLDLMAQQADALSAMAAALGDPGTLAEATKWQGNVLLLRGEPEAAAARLEDAADTALSAGHPYAAVCMMWLGWVSFSLGRSDRAETCARWLIEQGARPAEAGRLLGRALLAGGHMAAARKAMEAAVGASDATGLPLQQIYARIDAAYAALADGDPAMATAQGMEALDLADQIGATASGLAAVRVLIEAARQSGDDAALADLERRLGESGGAEGDQPRQQVVLPGESPPGIEPPTS